LYIATYNIFDIIMIKTEKARKKYTDLKKYGHDLFAWLGVEATTLIRQRHNALSLPVNCVIFRKSIVRRKEKPIVWQQ
jgi:hypothetical protein